MKKRWMVCLTAAAMTAVLAVPAYAGTWGQDETGYWYLNDSGSYARSQVMEIDGVKYAFNDQAYMVTGWYYTDGNWYYFDESGTQVTGWKQLEDKWYYMNPSNGGIMQKSWLKQGNSRYYFDESGVMKTGAFVVDGFYYLAESDGNLKRNALVTQDGKTLRYDDDGKIWYKNDENRVNGKSGGDEWLPYLEDTALAQQRAEVQESNQEYIIEKKDELYEEYKENVTKAKTTKTYNSKRTKWIEKVNRQLSALYVSQTEIDEYISDVTYGIYGNDDYYTEYDYDEDYDYYDYDD